MLAFFFNAAYLVTRQNSYLKNHFCLDVIGLFRFDDQFDTSEVGRPDKLQGSLWTLPYETSHQAPIFVLYL